VSLVASSTRGCCGGPIAPLCWRVRCTDCKQWVTKHDFTKDDALWIARLHDCPRSVR
jgi:hypothetical protein